MLIAYNTFSVENKGGGVLHVVINFVASCSSIFRLGLRPPTHAKIFRIHAFSYVRY